MHDPFRDETSGKAAIAEALDAIGKMEQDARERKSKTQGTTMTTTINSRAARYLLDNAEHADRYSEPLILYRLTETDYSTCPALRGVRFASLNELTGEVAELTESQFESYF